MSEKRQKKGEKHVLVAPQGSAIKHSAAIHVENSISLLQRRTWNVLLANAYDRLAAQETYSIKIQHLTDALGFDSKNERYLKDALKALAGCTVEWNLLGKDGSQKWGVTSLLAQAEIENGICTYAYSPALRKRLHNPGMYAKISLSIQKRFTSKYALALYELCLDYLFGAKKYGETPFIPVETYRKLMGVEEDTYPDFKRLNQRVIKEPIEEINEVTDLHVLVDYQKKERCVVAVKFRIRNAIKELDGGLGNGMTEEEDKTPSLVADLVNAGLSRDDAMKIAEQGFDFVSPENRPNRADFEGYVREKLAMLRRRMDGKKIKNHVGFLLEAIRKNYLDKEGEIQKVQKPTEENAEASNNLLALLREKASVEDELQRILEEKCAQAMVQNPEWAETALTSALKENSFLRRYVAKKKTVLENCKEHPPLAGAVNHRLRTDHPEEFAEAISRHQERLNLVNEKIAALTER